MNERDEAFAALRHLIDAVREELTDRAISYTVGERSVVFYGAGLGRLIAATINAEQALKAVSK